MKALQTILTLVGVFCGLFAVLAMLAVPLPLVMVCGLGLAAMEAVNVALDD